MKRFGMRLFDGKMIYGKYEYDNGSLIRCKNDKRYDVVPETVSMFPVVLFVRLFVWRVKTFLK